MLRLLLNVTTAVFDNTDHNPTSTTVHDSFHGTGISLVQHMTHENPVIDHGVTILVTSSCGRPNKFEEPPSNYTNVKPAILRDMNSTVPSNPVRKYLLRN